MIEQQEIISIGREELRERVNRLAGEGWRLVQIGCTRLEGWQIDYTFDREYRLLNLRLIVPFDRAEIDSISAIYWAAFTYENEIHDLFGVKVRDLKLDYGGRFYRLAVKAPFNAPKAESPPG